MGWKIGIYFLGMEMIFLPVGRIGTGNLRILPLQHRQLLNQQKMASITARATAELSRQYAHQNHTTKFACQPPREPVELPFRRIVSKWQIDILKGSHLNLGSLTF
ncbi:hypothetical protein L3X38_039956 [Prunus dulcis]|uniref:Uncharacterized protein n=1 Tax=Prunus dulcis TaxID=3755 RepID=A0AAD4V970_PRUDU|nr:hypothetical protein L3X38_039956 [Prunus dulcis]